MSAIIWCLFRSGKDKKYLALALVLFTASCLGIALIFWQFASYAGADAVAGYWKLRFADRSITNTKDSFPAMIGRLLVHLITSYGPLLILLSGSMGWGKMKKARVGFSDQEILFIAIYARSLSLYELVMLH